MHRIICTKLHATQFYQFPVSFLGHENVRNTETNCCINRYINWPDEVCSSAVYESSEIINMYISQNTSSKMTLKSVMIVTYMCMRPHLAL